MLSRFRTLLIGLAIGPTLAGIYVLSVGPAARMADEGKVSTRTLLSIYAPVVVAVRSDATLCAWFKDYCELWTGKAASAFTYAAQSED